MKPTHDLLLLRVSCLHTHQTVFNKENSYQQVYIQAYEKSYCYYIITMHVRELSKGVGRFSHTLVYKLVDRNFLY